MTEPVSPPRPSLARRFAALGLGLAGALVLAVGLGLLMLGAERRYGTPSMVGYGAVALAGVGLVILATRLARLPLRRSLIAALGSLLLCLPVADAVRRNVAGATSYAPAKRTSTELRNLGLALEARALDEGGFPAVASIDELAPLLEDRYLHSVPRRDGWSRPLRYEVEGSGKAQRYFVGSAGADGRWARARLADYATGRTAGDDIVYGNGGFVALPPP